MTLHYDFFSDHWLGMILYLLVAMINSAAVVIIVYLNVRSQKQKNDEGSAQEKHPLRKRLGAIAVVCIFTFQSIYFGISGFAEMAFFSLECARGNYLEVQGTVENVELEYQDENLYDVHFQVGDVVFQDLYNSFLPGDISCIRQGQQICIQYGCINGELAIHRIYTIDTTNIIHCPRSLRDG